MNRTTLLALAERVEAATAPDRGIEREIAIAVGWHFYDRKVDHTRPAIEQWWRPGATTPSTDFPRFMASLDAAMSLVPSGWVIGSLDWWPMRKESGVTLFETGDLAGNGWECHGYDNTVHKNARATASAPALALTAACLRARAIAGSMTDD